MVQSPSKVWKETEAEEAKTTASTGPSEAALSKAWFELYQKDLPEVQEVRAQILDLKQGEEITQQVLDSSPAFHLRWVADETHPPTVIGMHWIDHLDAGVVLPSANPMNSSLRMSGCPHTLELESPGMCPA